MSSAAKKRSKNRPRDPSPPFPILREPPSTFFPSRDELLKLFAVVAIAASVAVACNHLAGVLNQRPRPFCDSDGAVLDALSDFCDPCPENGLCSNGELECFHGYKKHGRMCIEDGEINQVANKLSEWIKQHVCDSYARVLCDETGKIWFEESDILEVLNEPKLEGNTGLKDDAYMLAKHRVMEILESFLETRAVFNGFLWIVRQKRHLSKRAEQLYEQVCEILEDNALSAKSTSSEGEPWMVASWLRDLLLLPRERKDKMLWKKVEELVLEDSRIDQYPKLVKGESKIVLEWQVDGPLSSKMKSKGASSKGRLSSYVDTRSPQESKTKLAESQHS